MIRRPPRSPLFPSTTLFRSAAVSLARTGVTGKLTRKDTPPLGTTCWIRSRTMPAGNESELRRAAGVLDAEKRTLGTGTPGYGSPASPRLDCCCDVKEFASRLPLPSACTSSRPWIGPALIVLDGPPVAIWVESTCQMRRPPPQLDGNPLTRQ